MIKKKETPQETITRLRRDNLELTQQLSITESAVARLQQMLEYEKNKVHRGHA